MPINMACPSCGKTLAAPDTAAGRRAKCPACGQIMIVPAVQQVEEPSTPPLPSSSPQPPAESSQSWLDELTGPAPAQQDAAVDSSGEARRPCPECGEMIIVGAAKCRFCNAIFDPRLRARSKQPQYDEDDNSLSAGEWVLCILLSFLGCIVGIVNAIQGKPKGMKMVGISVACVVVEGVIIALLAASSR